MADLKTGFLGPTRAAAVVTNYYDSASGVRPLQDQESTACTGGRHSCAAIRGARCAERYEVVKEWLKVMGAMALLAVALSVGVYTTSSTTTCVLCVSGVNAARIPDAPRLVREKEDAQRAELAQRAAAEEEARRRWQQAQVTYTWWSYSYWYSWWYHR